jgi:hypothetical protein
MATERETWNELVAEFDMARLPLPALRLELGRTLYNIKLYLHKHHLDKGRDGRWKPLLDDRKMKETTAKDWVVLYQKENGIPLKKCFYPSEMTRVKKPRKSHKNGQKNTAVSAALASDARIEFADDKIEPKNPKKRKRDKNGRLVCECFFVVTAAEKLDLVAAIAKLSEARATQLMCASVIDAAKDKTV